MIEVDLLDHMGSDTTVAKAARVSFQADEYRTDEDNVRLINYLAKHGHWSPFAHCFLQFRIKAPLFVARQLAKHQVGLSWNEVSRRYVDTPDFTPTAGEAGKQEAGSSGHIQDQGTASLILEDNPQPSVSMSTGLLSWVSPLNRHEWYYPRPCSQNGTGLGLCTPSLVSQRTQPLGQRQSAKHK